MQKAALVSEAYSTVNGRRFSRSYSRGREVWEAMEVQKLRSRNKWVKTLVFIEAIS